MYSKFIVTIKFGWGKIQKKETKKMIKIVKFEAGIKFKETINIQSCSLN
jgi:hypothetical protein